MACFRLLSSAKLTNTAVTPLKHGLITMHACEREGAIDMEAARGKEMNVQLALLDYKKFFSGRPKVAPTNSVFLKINMSYRNNSVPWKLQNVRRGAQMSERGPLNLSVDAEFICSPPLQSGATSIHFPFENPDGGEQ